MPETQLQRSVESQASPDRVASEIIANLERLGLADLPARPFDCAFSVICAPPAKKKLVVVGLNGSLADAGLTNRVAVERDLANPEESELERRLAGGWTVERPRDKRTQESGKPRQFTTLAKRLEALPGKLGFKLDGTIYTNSLLLCSDGADKIKETAEDEPIGSYEELRVRSMQFFEEVTLAISEPELIVAYSNSLGPFSAAQILYERFGQGQLRHYASGDRPKTWGFVAHTRGRRIPVVGIYHLSRFPPNENEIREVRQKLSEA